jgi:hypothetical protein
MNTNERLFQIKEYIKGNRHLRRLYEWSKPIVQLYPLYLVIEGQADHYDIDINPKIDKDRLKVSLLGPADMKQLAQLPGVRETEEELALRLQSGFLCLALRYDSSIIAYMWCNLLVCDHKHLRFQLNKDQAYLTKAYTTQEYRGLNLAPYLRCQFYKYLYEMGRTRLYSITDYLNMPAQRFKAKLSAKPCGLYLGITFLKRYRALIKLKNY